mgnify:CR=1 FL=1|jgi:hypothetical protein
MDNFSELKNKTKEELIAYFMELLAYAKESGIIVPSHHSDQK